VNAHDDVDSTRDRILTAAMQLFGEQGYAGTRVGQIEAAAGLSRGAGGLYRHFPSKKAVLEAGISRAIETGTDLVGLIDDPSAFSALPLEGRLLLVAQAALRRLEHDRDLNRLVCRDLAQFPDLLTMGWRRRSLDRCDVHHWFFYGIPSALIPPASTRTAMCGPPSP
jgi:AcrR family transcriptional regulator